MTAIRPWLITSKTSKPYARRALRHSGPIEARSMVFWSQGKFVPYWGSKW